MKIPRLKLYSLPMTRKLVGVNRILGKSPMKAKRAAIKQQDKAIGIAARGLNKIQKVKAGLNSAAMNPGGAVNRGTEVLLRHPISTTTQIAGKATMVVDPTGIGLVPVGAIGTGGEVALRKYAPRYARVTDKLGNAYSRSKFSRGVEAGTNAFVETMKNMM